MDSAPLPPPAASPARLSAAAAWSLVLIGVIGAIIVFAPILFSPGSGILRSTRNTNGRATNDALQLKSAISSYYTEYRRFPAPSADEEITLDSDGILMDALLASDREAGPDGLNPRRIPFYTGAKAKSAEGGGFRRGLTFDAAGGGMLWDPWGQLYRVRIDTSGDGRVENPESPGAFLDQSVIVWSAGRDGDFDTWKDNAKSWE